MLQASGVAPVDVEKLKDAGLRTLGFVIYFPWKDILQIEGITEATVDKIIVAASKLVSLSFTTAFQFYEGRRSLVKIPSGSREQILTGIETGSITEIYGGRRSGKTQLCYTLCVTCQLGIKTGETYLPTMFRVKKLSEKAFLPSRASALSAGYDLYSATQINVPARGKALIPTDLSIAIPEGTYARVAPRSGLTWKHSIDVGAGVIDADYRGPVGVILFNHYDIDFEVQPGDRIAQLIIEKIMTPEVLEVEDLDSTVRGSGGFGSTGV